jgi:hypothetical protein
MPYPAPVWDRSKNEMELFTVGPGATFNGQFNFGMHIAFGEIESLDGKTAIPILDQFVEMVESILRQVESECRALGFIK